METEAAGAPETPQADTLFDQMRRFMEDHQWMVEQPEGKPLLVMPVSGEHGRWLLFVHVHEDPAEIVLYSQCPAVVPAAARPALAEFVARANWGLRIGNFDFDLEAGEVFFRTSLDTTGTALNLTLVENLVSANLATMDDYLPGLLAAIYGGRSPREALALVEGEGGDAA